MDSNHKHPSDQIVQALVDMKQALTEAKEQGLEVEAVSLNGDTDVNGLSRVSWSINFDPKKDA